MVFKVGAANKSKKKNIQKGFFFVLFCFSINFVALPIGLPDAKAV